MCGQTLLFIVIVNCAITMVDYHYILVAQMVEYASSSSSFLACNSRLRCAVHRPHPPQRPVLGHIHCFRQCEIVGYQILLYDAQTCEAGALLQSSGGRVDKSMHREQILQLLQCHVPCLGGIHSINTFCPVIIIPNLVLCVK